MILLNYYCIDNIDNNDNEFKNTHRNYTLTVLYVRTKLPHA